MKTVSKSHNDDSNCSCESCLYKSESDRSSLKNLLARGSRIDRLYYGKYIPLREKKLLDRLVRTRAVYDDIRAQLLSDSTASLSTKANFVPKKKFSVKQLWSTEKSGTILKVVGMIDKGEILSSKNLSDCCSCCSCSSKIHIHNRSVRKQRHKHPYPGVQRRDNQLYERYGDAYSRKKGVRFKAKHIRSDPCTCTFKFSGLLKNHSKAMLRKLRTDAPLLVDLQATTDEEISQKRHRTADLARASYQILKQSQERLSDAMVEGIKKLNESKTKIRESLELAAKKSLEKLKQGKNKLKSKGKAEFEKNNKNAISNKNVARICECPEIDLVSQIKKDSVIKFKDDLKKKRMLKDWECEPECVATTCDPEECYIKLKQKRPHTKITKMGTYREKREKKIGVPISQSNIKIQADKKKIKPILRAQETEEIKSRVQFQTKNVQENDGKYKKHLQKCACEEKSKENVKPPKKSLPKISPPKKKVVNTEKAKVNQLIKNQIELKREAKLTNVHSASKRSSRQTVRIGSSFSFNIEFYKNRAEPIEKTYKLPARPTLAVKYSNYESKSKRHLYKRHNRSSQSLSKAKKKNKQLGRHKLKRCFCTLKLKGRKSRPKVKKRVTEETMTTDRSVMSLNPFLASCRPYDCIKNECNSLECKKTALKNIQTDTYHSKADKRQHLLPYECEPGICTPDYCYPHRCIKLINIRNAKVKKRSVKCSCCPSTIHSRKTKSTSSLTSRSYAPPKAKYAQSVIAYTRKPKNIREPIIQRPNYQRQLITTSIGSRQAVRIGSTFSFNIEFYKNKSPYSTPTKNLRSLAIKPKPKEVIHHKKKLKTRGHQKSSGSIYVTKPTQMTKKDRKANIGPALKRCFCTLKLQEKKHTKVKKQKMLTAGTETTNNSYFDIIMSNRSTKMDHKDVRLLEPFECEPFVCIPGECDPYVCLERIKTRHKKLRNAGISTKQPLIAVGSSTMYSEISSKTIQVHSKPKAKHQKTLTKPKKTTGSIRKMKLKDKTPKNISGKNSVNIGSSFSFNIEFSKSRSPMTFTQSEKWPERKSKMTSKNNAIDKKIDKEKINAHVVNENTQVKRSKNHHKASMMSPLLKRCFCTLNLQKIYKQHSFKKGSSNSFKQNLLPPRIYTINAMTEEFRNRSYLKISNQLCVVKSNYEYETKECSPIVDKSIFISKNREYIKEKIKPLNNLSLLGFTEICSKLGTDISLLKTSYENNSNKPIMNDNRNEIRNISNGNINKYIEQKKISLLHPKQRQTNHVAHYFKNCFNIMNLQIENNYYHFPVKRSKTVDILKNNKTIELLPYECEPGICTPGECNPYECQKLILKRTMKNKSTKSGSKNRTESISSNTRVLANKSIQNNKKICMKKFTPGNYKDLSDYGKNRVVRIGSSFNFNVEFFKNKKISRNYYEEDTSVTKLSSNVKARKLKKQTSKSLKSIGTTKDHKYHNMQSQSQLASVTHRASTTLPMSKRCFCTLKLHKKGRLHKGTNLQQLKFPYDQNIIKIHTNTRGQKTKKTKHLKTTHRLEPYECEPNICDPGNCDPYHCLEIMKSKILYNKTKESITERKLYKNKSIHSMTKKNQSKATQRKLPYSIIPPDKIRPKLTTDVIKPNSLSPSKQVVRVGSSFSFNIEFFKDRLPYHNEPILSNEKGFVEHKKYLKDIKQKHVARKHSTASTVQTTRNKKSQMQNIPQIASTMTSSFVKRCFCTAKLYQNKEKNIGLNLRKNAKPSFFKKCLCWLKLKKSLNTVNKDREINKKIHFDKKTITRNNMRSNMRIGRYECEPGICVPGECDPYECDAIRRERLKKHSQSSATPFIHSRSIHLYGPTNITKNAKTQSIVGKNKKNVKKSALIKTSSDRTEKQLVRIGSNFSFNIDFYKNNIPKHEDLTSQPVLRKPWHNRTKAKGSKIKKDIISVHSRHSQAMLLRKNDHSIGINNMKRCFCTLQFNNKSKETTSAKISKAKIKSIMTENSKLSPMTLLPYECEPNICIPNKCDPNQCDKIIQTHKERYQYKLPMQARLLPYECEPLTCVPGQCNPIECLERIKKRQNESKDFGTTIDAHNRYTASTMTKVNIKPKNKRNQSKVSHRMTAYKIPTDKLYTSNFHKQAVKIGSTFSFDLEFYKDNVSGSKSYHISDSKSYGKKKNNATLQTISKSPKIKKYDQHTSLLFINSKIQVPHVKQKEKKPVVRPFLKKCFCFFKLHNIETRRSPIVHPTQLTDQKYERRMNNNKYTVTERKKILPFECGPNVCVPGLCDPYECKKRIKRKSRNVSSQVVRQNSDKYTGIKAEKNKRKNQKNYINKLNDFSNQDDIEDRKRIVEVPRFANVFDKKAVKIGSNFSFHMEFYKHTLPQLRKMTFSNDHKKIDHVKKNSTSIKPINLNNRSSQAKIVCSKDKGLEAENILKRCFCTLKLQNTNTRPLKTNIKNWDQTPHYSQVVEVRRVSIPQKPKVVSQQTYYPVKAKATQSKNKYKNENISTQCICSFCQHCGDNNPNKMHTIYPYVPKRFNKMSSKTLISKQNIPINQRLKPTVRNKRLTKKKSQRIINFTKGPNQELPGKPVTSKIKKFLCQCVSLLTPNKDDLSYKRKNSDSEKSNIKQDKKYLDPVKFPKIDIHSRENYAKKKIPKKSKSLKLNRKNNNSIYPKECPYFLTSKKVLQQVGDDDLKLSLIVKKKINQVQIPKKASKHVPTNNNQGERTYYKCNSSVEHYKKNLESIKFPKSNLPSAEKYEKTKLSKKPRSFKLNNIYKNTSCKKKCPYFLARQEGDYDPKSSLKAKSKKKIPQTTSKLSKHMIMKKNKDEKKHDVYCKCSKMNKNTLCSHCQNKMQQKINQSKSLSPQLKVHFLDPLVLSQTNVGDKNKKIKTQMKSNKNRSKKNIKNLNCCRSCGRIINAGEIQKAAGDFDEIDKKKREILKFNKKTKPLFEMQLDSDDYDILNKDEIIDNVIDLGDHRIKDQSKYEAHTNYVQNQYASIFKVSQNRGKLNPCICGSMICAKENKKLSNKSSMSGQRKKRSWKKCVCGSPVCDRESGIMKTISPEKMSCICKKEKMKITKKKEKQESKLHAVRMKQHRKEDQIRRRQRQKADKEMAKRINKNASDVILLAESAIDIGKLGITACMDILRVLARMGSDPKHAYRNLKAMKADPKLIGRNLKIAFDDSGAAGTVKRIRLRCLALRGVKKIKTTLESYQLTNYLLHIAAKDPKKRMLKKKRSPRLRERLDFGCSLYMASLRKRPFISVYDRVPWFYPHFLSLLKMYKQFRDILLFLLAVVVWSPCILCMEACRAVMCCFFCTR